MTDKVIHKLNILLSYPVKWTLHSVMRDFVQNFYDAIGSKDFAKKFVCNHENGELIMQTPSSFDVDWLFYMGTSNKRDKEGAFAGRFGEGFKVAALVAYRDYHYDIVMESKNWRIKIVEVKQIIGGIRKACLAYEIYNRIDDGLTTLRLIGVREDDFRIFQEARDDFIYQGNPYIGQLIGSHSGYEVFRCPDPDETTGRIFAAYQNRYSLKGYPFIVSNPYFKPKRDDRDREYMLSSEAEECIVQVFCWLSPEEAFVILIMLKKYWWNDRNNTINSGRLISKLIWRVSESEKCCQRFVKEFGKHFVADFNRQIDRNRKRDVRLWFRDWEGRKDYKLVAGSFAKLGLIDIEKLCEREGGLIIERRPTKREETYIEILKCIAVSLFGDIIAYDDIPDTMIIQNDRAVLSGSAQMQKLEGKTNDNNGLRIKYKVGMIRIKASLLAEDRFAEALPVYLHELLHQYGRDSEREFHKSLLMMNRRIIDVNKELIQFREEWKKIG